MVTKKVVKNASNCVKIEPELETVDYMGVINNYFK